MRSRSWLVAVFVVMAVQMSPMLEKISAQSAPGIVISELRFSGPRGDNDEFIELFNASDADIAIGLWEVRVSGADSTGNAARFRIPTGVRVRPGCYYLMTFTPNTATAPGYTGSVRGDVTYGVGFADTGGVAIGPSSTALVDRVGFSPRTLYFEGTPITGGFSTLNRSFERLPGGGNGHVDTNNNAADFQLLVESTPQVTPVPNPQNSSSPCVEGAVKPHQVQGNGAMSLVVGAVKTVQGVITARAHNGFFIQTEVGHEDDDPNSSEGLFVFTGFGVTVPAAAEVGHLVKVTGTVEEFVPASDPDSAPRTQLRLYSMTDLSTAAMPDAYVLTPTDLSAAGAPDQLERLEGMRVYARSLTAVNRTASDGVFYAVLTDQFTDYGANPDRLRVDSDGIEGIDAVDVSNGAVMNDVTGPLDFESRTYTMFPEAPLAPFFPPDVHAPVIDPAENVPAVEATGPDGATVHFATPGAIDNRDDVVTVTCTPASGSVFGLGNSAVTCSAVDQAGNAAEHVGFTVIVQDTTAPVITVPDNISEEATSAAGRVVTYNATAHDAVSGSFVASCSRASGSTFPIGTTGVTCSAMDVAGNEAEDVGFTVTVADTTAPVFNPIIEAVTAEATGPNGAMVNFPVPTATDLDEMVAVNCSPAVGSLFGLGTTNVSCWASDAAGNPAVVWFTVTVQDTTAPVITVPEDISAQATSPAGRVVNYTATVREAVSESLVASCAPASGTTFPIGTTDVYCMASDAVGNVGEAHFSVSISQALQGRMHGAGTVGSGQQRASFTFDAGESANQVDRGWLMMLVKDGAGRPRSFAGKVDYVSFSDAEGYTPGQMPASGVDTVMFSGVGSWNGRSGYTFRVTASDRGEPGVNDTFTVVVTSPTGVVVESASGALRGGNIQSLR